MSRLPIVSSDNNAWGSVLNDFLSQAHNADGSIKNLFVNVKDPAYGAKGDGTTDDTTAIANARSAANAAGGGTVIYPFGTYISGNQTLYSNVIDDLCGSTIKLKNGANTDLFSAQTGSINLAAAFQSSINGTLSNFGIRNGILDGNKANQTSGPSYPLRFYGYNYLLSNLEIKNGYSGGILSDWNGNLGNNMEATIGTIKIHDCGGMGFQMGGPHDSRVTNILSWLQGTHGFHFAPNAVGTLCTNIHPYALTQSAGAVGVLAEADSMSFVDCVFEGSDSIQFAALANNISINGGMVLGNTGYAGTGIKMGQQAGGTVIPGQIKQSAGVTTSATANLCMINTKFMNNVNGAIDFSNESLNSIRATIYQTSGGVLVSGHTPSATDSLFINVSGLTSDHTWNTQGGIQLASSNATAFLFSNAGGTNLFDLDGNGKLFSLVNGTNLLGYSDNYTTQTIVLNTNNGSIRLNNASSMYSGSGAPGTGLGAIGDYYFRSDTPSTANQRIYVKTGAS